ncbi:DMT family transporter [Undibacterium sp. Di27W]|uniref:DMT family transporter n=1 Tax=Undibacterium sp. Di27W TaxID=3413036 RepID=UPI003BF022AB
MNMMTARLFGATFLWATVFHVGKFAMQQFSPLAVVSWRNAIAGLVLTGLTLPALRTHWLAIRAHLGILLILAMFGVLGFSLFMFYGLRSTSSVNAALIMAFNPALIVLLNALLNREKIRGLQALGLGLGLLGVLIVVAHGSLQALLNLHISQGDMLVTLASLCWSVYCVLPRRYASQVPSAILSSMTVSMAAVMLMLLAFAEAPDIFVMPPMSTLLAMLFLGLFGTVLPYLWWNRSVQEMGPAKAGVYMNLVPVFASLVGVALGQQLESSQLLGAVFVVAGVLLTNKRPAA